MTSEDRAYRAGETVDDLCRACRIVRRHTVVVADPAGPPRRVICDYCGSQHNYRGGDRATRPRGPGTPRAVGTGPAELVSERERSQPPMSVDSTNDLELLLRRIIREETGLTPVVPADRWVGGELVLVPGRQGLQEKRWPIESFFHKIVMIRNRLRVLEQQVNGSDLPADQKLKLQGYVTACYGTLTSFNIFFADEEDRFRGSGGKEG